MTIICVDCGVAPATDDDFPTNMCGDCSDVWYTDHAFHSLDDPYKECPHCQFELASRGN